MGQGQRLAGLSAAALLVAGASQGCRQPAGQGVAQRGEGTLPAAIAEAVAVVTSPSGATVTVTGVRRTSQDVVQVDLVAANPGPAGVDLAAEFGGTGGLAQAFLLSDDGRARVFVLADERGTPQCSSPSGMLAVGERQTLYLRFAARSAAAHRVTLALPGLPPIADLGVPAADGPS